jgi:hypothetical protein
VEAGAAPDGMRKRDVSGTAKAPSGTRSLWGAQPRVTTLDARRRAICSA